ncbi:S-layer homology domain-containing protein [Alkalicoccus urumqiensis]|uniref:SLH domain-containing protein n=1 Tax=Alkalicoccus urumqiensis TaxID=1548213 RepID=A0A2P6MIT7_ALKUR|nr:S-layer homology domain-containing protein [Alkalicoccus urumqiensis]PRO66204.1 hypothetical protein C6I21_05210 [Alkalicoccus urumqiensis]
MVRYRTQIMAAALSGAVLFPAAAGASHSFPDVGDAHWAHDVTGYLTDLNILGGYPDGSFQPNRELTRAETAVILTRALDLDLSSDNDFTDVSESSFAASSIAAVADAGIMNGNDGKFFPGRSLTRAEMAAVLTRAFNPDAIQTETRNFPDLVDGAWYSYPVERISRAGMTEGYPDGTFQPNRDLTRAEFATFIGRAMDPEMFSDAYAAKQKADEVVDALAAADMGEFSSYVYTDGVRFTPYGYVTDDDVLFGAGEIEDAWNSGEDFYWGDYDGTGDDIIQSFSEYYDEFIYDRDYASAPQTAYNQRIGEGNSLNNIDEYYPDGVFVEYHYPGSDEFAGMDWSSLRIVMVESDGEWYVVGVIHDEWTI